MFLSISIASLKLNVCNFEQKHDIQSKISMLQVETLMFLAFFYVLTTGTEMGDSS